MNRREDQANADAMREHNLRRADHQDALRLVPGRESHEALMKAEQASARRQSIDRATRFGLLVESRRDSTPPGACVLCGHFPDGSLVRESDVAGMGNLDG